MNALTKLLNKEQDPFRTLWRMEPLREMESAVNRIEHLFGHWPSNEPLATAQWSPVVDITEDEKEYSVKAELPEVKKEGIKVTVLDGTLSITGERKVETEEKTKHFHRIERSYGNFERRFSLPDDADPGKITSEFHDGVLTVHLPKNPATAPKAIEVKVA